MVQFYRWFKFISFCFKLIITHYHTQKQKKVKFEPRINLNHNKYFLISDETVQKVKGFINLKTVLLFLIFYYASEGQHEQITGKLYFTLFLPPKFARLFELKKVKPSPCRKTINLITFDNLFLLLPHSRLNPVFTFSRR